MGYTLCHGGIFLEYRPCGQFGPLVPGHRLSHLFDRYARHCRRVETISHRTVRFRGALIHRAGAHRPRARLKNLYCCKDTTGLAPHYCLACEQPTLSFLNLATLVTNLDHHVPVQKRKQEGGRRVTGGKFVYFLLIFFKTIFMRFLCRLSFEEREPNLIRAFQYRGR